MNKDGGGAFIVEKKFLSNPYFDSDYEEQEWIENNIPSNNVKNKAKKF